MRRIAICMTVLLSACVPQVQESAKPTERRTTSPVREERTLEQVPSELSIEHFSNMRLEGTDFTLGEVEYRRDAYTRYAISYRSNGLLISGVMNIPHGDGPFPLVLLNHGFISPTVYTRGRGLKREQDYLARQGFAVLHSDYRGYAESDKSPDTREVYDASLEYSMDIVNAIRAVRAANLPKVDASWVGMLGHSLGGGITLNIATAHPEVVNAVVLYASVHTDAWENFMRWRSMRDEGDRTRAYMGTRAENPQAWDKLSSQAYLDRIQSPVLVFHGDEDSDVPKSWSDDLVRRLEDLGKPVQYVEYPGEKHEFIPHWDDFMKRTAAFFKGSVATRSFSSEPSSDWGLPLHRTEKRVTKKPLGIFITPKNSPVSPERFRGYHTGTDFELFPGEKAHNVSVRAACTGPLVFKDWVNGYGGVVVQRCELEGEPVTVLYGHLWIDSITTSLREIIERGDPIGVLGEGGSRETDGERAHLHFAIHRGDQIELKGYVQSEDALDYWVALDKVMNQKE